ncbi:MAG TPA: Uma2 family endonuclease [Acetobacteraceae bacterium]|nr:Uma2 family endonuclease [Acetobacteraceae bacterium]
MRRMSREEWRRWSQDHGARSERVQGEVVAMAPERWAHARAKANILLAFRAALAGRPDCVAVPDGMTVEIDDDTDYEPDVAIHCGGPIPDDSTAIPTPVVVVEVLSPATRHIDTHIKLGDYFRVPSIQHYLLVRADRREVMHYKRNVSFPPALTIMTSGTITLDPPGIALHIQDVYG